MTRHHLFTQLPCLKAALLALPILSTNVASHVLPRETYASESQHLSNVVSWPILALATPAPASTPQLLRRESDAVCGYIDGDPDLPATCLAGSHCAVDVEHGAVGCCADDGPCEGGIFTGCVDGNSGPQSMADPYVFTCAGRNVCYKNNFAGGYFQYGCGTASGLAATVLPTAAGRPALKLMSISVKLTATPTPLSRPTTSTDFSSRAMSNPAQPSTTDGAAAPSSQGSRANTDAIIGGTVGGVASVIAFALLVAFLWRRKSKRNGASSADAQEPKNSRSMALGNPNFEPYTSLQGVAEIRSPTDRPPNNRGSDGVSTESGVLGSILQRPHYVDAVEGTSLSNAEQSRDSDRVPLTRELDEFSQEFSSALEGIEPDSDADTQHSGTYPGPRRGGGGGILWHQNRKRSRNLGWT